MDDVKKDLMIKGLLKMLAVVLGYLSYLLPAVGAVYFCAYAINGFMGFIFICAITALTPAWFTFVAQKVTVFFGQIFKVNQ